MSASETTGLVTAISFALVVVLPVILYALRLCLRKNSTLKMPVEALPVDAFVKEEVVESRERLLPSLNLELKSGALEGV